MANEKYKDPLSKSDEQSHWLNRWSGTALGAVLGGLLLRKVGDKAVKELHVARGQDPAATSSVSDKILSLAAATGKGGAFGYASGQAFGEGDFRGLVHDSLYTALPAAAGYYGFKHLPWTGTYKLGSKLLRDKAAVKEATDIGSNLKNPEFLAKNYNADDLRQLEATWRSIGGGAAALPAGFAAYGINRLVQPYVPGEKKQ